MTIPRIDYISSYNKAQTYLEIGVNDGATFLNINLPYKVAVDPCFRFDFENIKTAGVTFFQNTSDVFFEKLPKAHLDHPSIFDLIFIDGLHTFEQSFRDFENSLTHAHDKTVWIVDDVVPSDPYSAVPDLAFSLAIREKSGISGTPWHGDVFKTVFAIHDKYPEFSYCTLMGGNPQLVLWKTKNTARKPIFASIDEIQRLSYFDIFKYANVFVPTDDEQLPNVLGTQIDPSSIKAAAVADKLLYRKARAVRKTKKGFFQKLLQKFRDLEKTCLIKFE